MKQNEYLELGKINTLFIDRLTTPGAYLMALDGNDVLLPGPYLTPEMKERTLVDVFLYTDSEDRLVATTLTPTAKLDEMALFEVIDTAPFGAFMDWGLSKDLLVPNMFQKTPFKVGEKRFIRVIYDERTHRLVGTEKLGDFFEHKVKGIKIADEVNILIIAKTPLGYKCIVEDKYEGLIYHNEIFENIKLGDRRKAFVKDVRKDGNIDLNLRKAGSKKSGSSSDKVLDLLKENNGIMPYNYKSDAELIKNVFGLSKKDFKRSLTTLQEAGEIDVKDTGIYIKD
ncbi:protein containing nucleic acid binding domain [Sulfurimonas gotlandica GD1]|jgi:predicted RNA-binding protein (virulence factor B family)|uniref:Protein containing nucleic acid binding domain n=1 Tax=Sulfurimonas gotlandica (strain DSM 19862 / JCM 16533 / GD1) TaxID=929558 RepID=B6BLU8_SULGG|nr:S1-like domain-containing RNA-binding protein [Sulfurimonas gotlandica]EDZ61770.1 nucleic acid binding protein [Sulfurimonas gotlandica GD1]EHP29480.1 protein containing nucleic acid binding domain [Sulfurimonas gotlandica GD1]